MDRRDQVLALFLDALGIDQNDLSTFDGRKSLQKAIYLLQQPPHNWDFGFRYNLYIKGPYSPSLANAGYMLLENPGEWERVRQQMELTGRCKRDIVAVSSKFVGADGQLDSDLLEVAATLHFLVSHTFAYVSDSKEKIDQARKWIDESKPLLQDRFIDATKRLRALGMLS